MKKAKLVSTLALAVLSATAQAGPTEALTLPSSVWFNGFCDGLTNITQVTRQSWSATYDATTFCGQFSTAAGGPAGRSLAGGSPAVQGAVFAIESYPFIGITAVFAIRADGTFAVYDINGNLLNKGTWTAGVVANQRGTASSLQR